MIYAIMLIAIGYALVWVFLAYLHFRERLVFGIVVSSLLFGMAIGIVLAVAGGLAGNRLGLSVETTASLTTFVGLVASIYLFNFILIPWFHYRGILPKDIPKSHTLGIQGSILSICRTILPLCLAICVGVYIYGRLFDSIVADADFRNALTTLATLASAYLVMLGLGRLRKF